jgi:hypothetical protein
MSKLRRLIKRRSQNGRPSPLDPAVYQENGEQVNSESPLNEPLPVGSALEELTEIGARIKQASLKREAQRVMRMDLSSYRGHEKGSVGPTVKSEMSYAEFFGINFEWLSAGNPKDHEVDGTSLDFSVGDEDFYLVLRHFWDHLGPEKRRKLIQLAANLVDHHPKEQ